MGSRGSDRPESDGGSRHLPLSIHRAAKGGLRLLPNIVQQSMDPKPCASLPRIHPGGRKALRRRNAFVLLLPVRQRWIVVLLLPMLLRPAQHSAFQGQQLPLIQTSPIAPRPGLLN